ncbi:LamB/YcsF family protein [Corynebacterium kozikiae]|uniref:LamB/YcsF family protein n=1 Tax=Corynebacterium kozikiae TaxID=2968469 RepID=UPI00211C1AF2|nr:5-oxoprolinase subunit PxpA [Corynebacterium sp. 76QC2CO]MCQ9343300.1 LamB/YcsF family protein [Corynebacterium sp. 76QC2CO]
MAHIDLNADLGESFGAYIIGADSEMLQVVSSANIACGFHAGDPQVLLATVRKAAELGVRVGAHPGYRDLQGFGRRNIAYSPDDLFAEVVYQIGAVQAAAAAAGVSVEYVKPHGAMYNTIAQDAALAKAVIAAVQAVDPNLRLMCLAGAPIVGWAADAGLRTIQEAFADRAYTPEGTLVPRNIPGAVHHDPLTAIAQAKALATGEPVVAIDGSDLHLQAESICVHGDTPAAVEMARGIRAALQEAGVEVKP